MRECRYSSSERWNSSRSLRFTGTARVSDDAHVYHDPENTLEDLAELLDGQETAAMYLTTVVLVTAEPAPEQSALALLYRQYWDGDIVGLMSIPRPASDGSTCC